MKHVVHLANALSRPPVTRVWLQTAVPEAPVVSTFRIPTHSLSLTCNKPASFILRADVCFVSRESLPSGISSTDTTGRIQTNESQLLAKYRRSYNASDVGHRHHPDSVILNR